MSMTFTKLFSSITESTVWCEPSGTRLVWITMLAKADRNGRVFASVPGLANLARVSLDEASRAIETFLAPDEWSRTPDFDGRRIEKIDGGWRLLNYIKYRTLRDQETVREAKREHMRRRREEEREATGGTAGSTVGFIGTNAEAEAEAEAEKSKSKGRAAPGSLPEWLPSGSWEEWDRYRKAKGGWTQKARALTLRTLSTLRDDGHSPKAVIEQSIECGWTGLFPLRGAHGHGTTRSMRPRASDDVRGVRYYGTPDHELPEELRDVPGDTP